MSKNADIPKSHVPKPLLIILSGTEPYYTMSVWHVGECRHSQVRSTHPWINSSAIEPYCTMSVWHVEEYRHTQVRYTIPQLNLVVQSPTTPCQFEIWQNGDVPISDVHHPTHWTQYYRVLLHHVNLICGRMQMYPNEILLPQYTCKLTEMLSCNYSK